MVSSKCYSMGLYHAINGVAAKRIHVMIHVKHSVKTFVTTVCVEEGHM